MGDVNIDSMKVFANQYPGSEYKLKPSQFMASISYRIISTYNKTCYTIC
jgi:ArsR family metal-binding transcriptional regulator